MLLSALLACALGVADPRPALRAELATAPPGSPTVDASLVQERLLLGQIAAACTGLRARVVAEGREEDWRWLLLAAARVPAEARVGGACLTDAQGDVLAAWAEPRAAWRGARAEWMAARGDLEGALALLGPTGDDAARLRVLLARGEGDAARNAAEGALVEQPRDVLACRIVALAALAEGDAAWAIESAACGGVGDRAPELVRLRAEALDQAGEYAAAEAEYARAGLDVHRAALLYQEAPTPERLAEAARLLGTAAEGRPPPAALHAVWLALLGGGEPSIDGLDQSVPATLARALVRGSEADVAALSTLPGAPAAVVRARLAAARGDSADAEAALAEALEAAPAAEPVHRARVAVRLSLHGDVDGALAAWAAQDSDHVGAIGSRGTRDLPWAALVPETWAELAVRHPDPRMRFDAPAGADAVGARIRMARALADPRARADALASLSMEHPGLDALVSERYRSAPSVATVSDRDP